MNHHAADVMGVGEAHVLPGLAAVGGLVNAVAPGRTLAIVGFAGADPDDRRIGRRDGDVADGGDAFLVEDRLPGGAIVGGFPDAAGSHADKNNIRIAFDDCEIVDAAAHDRGTDFAEFQRFEFVHWRRFAGGGLGGGSGCLFILFLAFVFLAARRSSGQAKYSAQGQSH